MLAFHDNDPVNPSSSHPYRFVSSSWASSVWSLPSARMPYKTTGQCTLFTLESCSKSFTPSRERFLSGRGCRRLGRWSQWPIGKASSKHCEHERDTEALRKAIAVGGHVEAMAEIDTLLAVAQSETNRRLASASH